MPLINCRECQERVSSKSKACPACGVSNVDFLGNKYGNLGLGLATLAIGGLFAYLETRIRVLPMILAVLCAGHGIVNIVRVVLYRRR